MPEVLRSIDTAAEGASPFLISTPNINFLVNSQTDPQFRESLLLSDLCPPDGMPVVWIARLLGIPIRRRVAGSDILESLKEHRWNGPGDDDAVGVLGFPPPLGDLFDTSPREAA